MRAAATFIFIVLSLIGPGLCIGAVVHAESSATLKEAPASDDGWRRTTRGWEPMSAWQQPQVVASAEEPIDAPPLLAFALIACGAVGGLVLLFVEIDPPEYHSFRLKSRR